MEDTRRSCRTIRPSGVQTVTEAEKLYEIDCPPTVADCAEATPHGLHYETCEICKRHVGFPRPDKRIVEWDEGSDRVCDFVQIIPAIGEILVTERVRKAFQGLGVEFLPVEFYQDPKLKRPQRVTKRSKRRVWLPYEGPPLYVLWAPTWVHADLECSSFRPVGECPRGHRRYELEGIERWELRRDDEKGLVHINIPRQPGKGIRVHRADLHGAEIFRLHERPGAILCTERVRAIIVDRGFSNVELLEVGDVLEP